MSTKIIRLELSEKLWLNTNMDIPCHDIPCFYFYFLFRNNGKREQSNGNDFRCFYGNFFWKCHSESTWSQLCSKSYLNNYEAHWQRHLKGSLKLKISQTWIDIGVESATKHSTYYCMVLFLSNKSSFKFNLVLIE